MKCRSIDRGTPKSCRIVCKCIFKVFCLIEHLSSIKTQDFNPQEVRRASPPLLVWESPQGVLGPSSNVVSIFEASREHRPFNCQ